MGFLKGRLPHEIQVSGTNWVGNTKIGVHGIKVKIKFTLKQYTKTQEGSRGIAYSFLNLGSRMGWVVNVTPRPLYPRERPGIHCIGDWVSLRAGPDGYENFRPP